MGIFYKTITTDCPYLQKRQDKIEKQKRKETMTWAPSVRTSILNDRRATNNLEWTISDTLHQGFQWLSLSVINKWQNNTSLFPWDFKSPSDANQKDKLYLSSPRWQVKCLLLLKWNECFYFPLFFSPHVLSEKSFMLCSNMHFMLQISIEASTAAIFRIQWFFSCLFFFLLLVTILLHRISSSWMEINVLHL